MRAIKFRVWDGARMEANPLVRIDMYGVPWFDSGECGEKPVDWPVMQCTGLKDKNGKEIYEGDVIVCNGAIVDKGAMIQWSEHHACWSIGEDWPWSDFYDGAKGQVEVIGNIYENPELLEGEE